MKTITSPCGRYEVCHSADNPQYVTIFEYAGSAPRKMVERVSVPISFLDGFLKQHGMD